LDFSYFAVISSCSYFIGTAGNNYAKGDILYPVGRGPRGSIAMLIHPVLRPTVVVDPFENSLSIAYKSLEQLCTNVPVTSDEVALAAICKWGGPITVAALPLVCKYMKRFDNIALQSATDRYASQVMNPGGTFIDALSEAMRSRHGAGMLTSGLGSANSNVDACLWDAVKPVVGMIANAIQPLATEAAAFTCGAIPVVGFVASAACKSGAEALFAYVQDVCDTSTNRRPANTPEDEKRELVKIVGKTKALQMNELPENRSKLVDSYGIKRSINRDRGSSVKAGLKQPVSASGRTRRKRRNRRR